MIVKIFRVTCLAWFAVPALLAADALLPAEVAKHLEEKGSLTYAALFVAAIAICATVWLVKVILALQEKARADYITGMDRVGRLADAMEKLPCQLVKSGLADVVIRDADRHSLKDSKGPQWVT